MALTRDEIHNAISMLAQSQGFYGRLQRLQNYPEILDMLEAQKLEDAVELVTALES